MSARRRIVDSAQRQGESDDSHALSSPSALELDMHRIGVSDAAAAAPHPGPNERLPAVPPSGRRPPRKDVLSVSPFVFAVVPCVCFYAAAVLASLTLNFGSKAECSDRLNSFLWGAILLGYTFVIGFGWMVAGPRVDRLMWKWGAMLVYTGLLGALTALGLQEINHQQTKTCKESSWYYTVWIITGWYGIFWAMLFFTCIYEVSKSVCFADPSHRVVILGVGAGFNKLHLRPVEFVGEMFDSINRGVKGGMKDVKEALGGKGRKADTHGHGPIDPNLNRKPSSAALELAILEGQVPQDSVLVPVPRSPDSLGDQVKTDNFFGAGGTSKRGSWKNDKDRLLLEQETQPQRSFSFKNMATSSSVAPSPEGSDNEDNASWRSPISVVRGDQAKHSAQQGQQFDPLHDPTPAKRQPLAPLPHDEAAPSDDDEDPFARKIAVNKAQQERRRAEIEELQRAQAEMQGAPTSMRHEVMSVAAPTPLSTQQVVPASAMHHPAPLAASQPIVGILRPPNTTSNRMQMVEFEHGAKLEAVRTVQPVVYDDNSARSGTSDDQHSQQHYVYAQQQQQQQSQLQQQQQQQQQQRQFFPSVSPAVLSPPSSFDVSSTPFRPSGPPASTSYSSPVSFAPNYNTIASPGASPSPSPSPSPAVPLPSSSTMLSAGPVYPSADDPQRFSKLAAMRQGSTPSMQMQMQRQPMPPLLQQPQQQQQQQHQQSQQLAQQQQHQQSQQLAQQQQRMWPPPPPLAQQQQMQPPQHNAYNSILDNSLEY